MKSSLGFSENAIREVYALSVQKKADYMRNYAQNENRKGMRFAKKQKKNAGSLGSGLNAAGDYTPEGDVIETSAEETLENLLAKMTLLLKGWLNF